MYLKYGSFTHSANEATIAIGRRTRLDDGGRRIGYTERWDVQGRLAADTQSALTSAIDALKTAYATHGQDLGLYLDDGTTVTSHVLSSSAAIGGVRIVEGPSFPNGTRAEYSTFRNYSIGVEADFSDPGAGLLGWSELLAFSGGGPRFVFLQTLNGIPQKQLVADSTPYRVTQSGRALGHNTWPAPPDPIWPGAEHRDQRQINRQVPRRTGSGASTTYTNYEISWQYFFESAFSLSGDPTKWV